MIKPRIVFSMFIFHFVLVSQLFAQGVWKSASEEIFNLAAAPAKIERNRNGKYLRLRNFSSKTVTDFRFGCISKKGKTLAVILDFAPKIAYFHENRIESNGSLIFGIELSGIQGCSSTNELLTITRLTFEDKSIWKITEHINLSPYPEKAKEEETKKKP